MSESANFQSGVYQIYHTPSGRRYVGSSTNIHRRFGNHKSQLNRGRHPCRELQALWISSEGDGFLFQRVDEVRNAGHLRVCEQFWIEKFRAFDKAYGFNVLSSYSRTNSVAGLRTVAPVSALQAKALRLAAYKEERPAAVLVRLAVTDWLERKGYLDTVRRELEEIEPAAE